MQVLTFTIEIYKQYLSCANTDTIEVYKQYLTCAMQALALTTEVSLMY